MLKGITLPEAIQLIGHQKGTKTREILAHLPAGKRRMGMPDRQALCVARPVHMPSKGNWHWVLYIDGVFYDPNLGKVNKESYQEFMKISSHYPVHT